MCRYCDLKFYSGDIYVKWGEGNKMFSLIEYIEVPGAIDNKPFDVSLDMIYSSKIKKFGLRARGKKRNDKAGVIINYCPFCGRKLREE